MSTSITVPDIVRKKREQEKIVMVTAYDATFAAIFDQAEMDIVLVGDSLGMVIQGHDSTLPVKIEHVLYHTQAVRRTVKRAHLVADLPFLSYQISSEQALASAGLLIQEGGAQSVKMEGGRDIVPSIMKIVAADIPVMGHIGLTPQSVHKMGGYKVQGKDAVSAQRLLEDAKRLEDAGCYAVVLEGIPRELALEITQTLSIPTIGIGAGPDCDGQVLVCYDLLGLNPHFTPKFVKPYANLHAHVLAAARTYACEVRENQFPSEEHSFHGKRHEQSNGKNASQHDAQEAQSYSQPSR